MNSYPCPVCETPVNRSTPLLPCEIWAGESFSTINCEQCGTFSIADELLASGWSEVSATDKHAIAVYLNATKATPGCVRDLTSQSWRHWAYLVHIGKEILASRSGAIGKALP